MQGVGPADSDNIMLVVTYGGFPNPPDHDLCDELRVLRNGLVECFTKPGVIEPQGFGAFAVTPTVRVKDISSGPGSGTTHGCGGIFTDCPDYVTFEPDAAQPRVEAAPGQTELPIFASSGA